MKRNVFWADASRALMSRGFMVSVMGMVIAVFLGGVEQLLPIFQGQYSETGLHEGFVAQALFMALSSDTVLLVVPVLCAIPYTAVFLDDYKSRFIRQYLPRAGRRAYVGTRVVMTALSGGLSLVLGMIIVAVIFMILFLPMEVPMELTEVTQDAMLLEGTNQPVDVVNQKYLMEFMGHTLLFFLSGCFWSLAGGLLAALTMSKYMAYASPFILYYVLVIFSERYFENIYVWNPKEWLTPISDWAGGIWGVALLVMELINITGFLYGWVMERKLHDG